MDFQYVTPFSCGQEIVKTLEEKRKARAQEYYAQKQKAKVIICQLSLYPIIFYCFIVLFFQTLKEKAMKVAQPQLMEINKQLEQLGYA